MRMPLLMVTLLMVTAQAGMGATEDDRPVTRVFLPPSLAQLYVRQAIEGAMDRLQDPECRQVMTDFTDDAGHLLLANLQTLDQSAPERLSDMLFVDASDEPACLDPVTGAYTTPGSRVVFVCAARFATSSAPLSGAAGEILVIHELLHSLGLGESPSTLGAPTSAQITRQVWARCGDAHTLAYRNRQNWTSVLEASTKPSIRVAARPGFLR